MKIRSRTASPSNQTKVLTENDSTDVLTQIIALISCLLWPTLSKTPSSVTPVQAQQDIGLINTTGSKPLMVVPQKQSNSTTSANNTVGQKKEDGGTKLVKPSPPTASSPKSNASDVASNSRNITTYSTKEASVTVEIFPQLRPPSAQGMQHTIPPSGLTIARY